MGQKFCAVKSCFILDCGQSLSVPQNSLATLLLDFCVSTDSETACSLVLCLLVDKYFRNCFTLFQVKAANACPTSQEEEKGCH